MTCKRTIRSYCRLSSSNMEPGGCKVRTGEQTIKEDRCKRGCKSLFSTCCRPGGSTTSRADPNSLVPIGSPQRDAAPIQPAKVSDGLDSDNNAATGQMVFGAAHDDKKATTTKTTTAIQCRVGTAKSTTATVLSLWWWWWSYCQKTGPERNCGSFLTSKTASGWNESGLSHLFAARGVACGPAIG
jgi:hypothetical protein